MLTVVCDLNLTKKKTLFFKTIEIIKRLLPQEVVARWESVEPNHRPRRILKYEMLDIHVD